MRSHTISRKQIRLLNVALLCAFAVLVVGALSACTADSEGTATSVSGETSTQAAPSSAPSGALGAPDPAEAAAGTQEPERAAEPVDETNPVSTETSDSAESRETDAASSDTEPLDVVDEPTPLPLLIDLGAKSCIPCKMMAPILEELTETKIGYFDVQFIDVWEDRSKAQEFGIRAIPTQIFFSAQGEELFRHEGYFSRKQILDKWRELGVDVGE